MRWAYCVVTYSGAKLVETVHSVPKGERLLVVDNSQTGWSLSKAWNYGIERLCGEEGYDAAILMNDDIVLREDTGEILARGLLEEQQTFPNGPLNDGRLLLLISARHASPSDAFTDTPDWDLLGKAEPRWQPGPDYSCFVTSLNLLRLIGPFDEGFNPCYFEDNDSHRRIQLAGYEAAALAPYWHFRSGTYRTDAAARARIDASFEGNKQRYIQKWGGIPGQERYLRPYNV